MKITIGKNKEIEVGFKTYVAFCAGLLNNGLKPRVELNTLLLNTKVDNNLLPSFLTYFLPERYSPLVHQIISNPSYSFLRSNLITAIELGIACLYIEKTSNLPNELSNEAASLENRNKWLTSALIEIIQYPPLGKLHPVYVSLPYGTITFYKELALFTQQLIPVTFLLQIFYDCSNQQYNYGLLNNVTDVKKYELSDLDYLILNSLDEVGIVVWFDDYYFTWSSNNIKDRILNIDYKQLWWIKANKIVKTLTIHKTTSKLLQ